MKDGPAATEFKILGDLTVCSGDVRIEIVRPRLRSLLAVLLLNAGERVPSERLSDGIWGDAAPASDRELVRVYVSKLRELLGADSITTRTGGYAIDRDLEIDASRFEQLVGQARAAREESRGSDSLAAYDEALALWRGDLLADTPVEGDAALRAARLDELRLTALEERFDVALSLGFDLELVPELEKQVAVEPLREGLRAQLMLALYRAGRQADALATYQQGRQYLSEHLGLEPGAQLKERERAILRHDSTLAAPVAQRTVPIRRRPHRALVAAVSLFAIAATVVVLLLLLPRATHVPKLQADSVGAFDPSTGALRAQVRVPPAPAAFTVGGGRIWVADSPGGTLAEIAPGRMQIVKVVGLPAVPHELIYGGQAVWAANGFDGTLTRIGPGGLVSPPVRPDPSSDGRLALAYGLGSLWIGSQDNVISRIDASSGKLLASIHGVITPEAAAIGFHAVWVAQATRVTLLRIDPNTSLVAKSIPLGAPATALAVGAGAIWALSPSQSMVWRIDPQTNAVTASIQVDLNPSAIAANATSVWVLSASSGTLTQIDPRQNTVVQTLHLRQQLAGIAISRNQLWIASR